MYNSNTKTCTAGEVSHTIGPTVDSNIYILTQDNSNQATEKTEKCDRFLY